MKYLNIFIGLSVVISLSFSSFAQQANYVFQSRGVPANPKESTHFTQPDGSIITIYMHGDAMVNWAETSDGYSLLMNDAGGFEYAAMSANGDILPSGVLARNLTDRSIVDKQKVGSIPKHLRYSPQQVEAKVANHQFFANSRSQERGFPTTGTRKMLMILANFNNTSTTYTQTQFDNYMNQLNYNGTGSFKDYYLENSYGQLTIVTTVTAWVTLPNPHDYYGAESKWGEFAYDAVVAANNSGVDYSQYDNDGNGTVDGVAIIHQGPGQESTGSTDDIWSHSWDLASAGYSSAARIFDGVKVSSYTTQPETMWGDMASIGVMCHEFGHNLGAPDYYDTDYNDNGSYDGTGEWDVMASGSYNGSPSGSKPAHHNAFTKIYYYEWATATLLTTAQTITLDNAAENSGSFYRYNTNTTDEFFLIENRQKTKFDSYIPGHGMIIYHVDEPYIESAGNGINIGSHQGMYPMAANSTTANGVMLQGGNINTSGCPWPGTSSKTFFTDASTPNAKSWANANTAKPLTNISENTTNKTVTFCFISCNSVSTSTITGSPFCAGTAVNVPYTISGSVNAGNVFTAQLSDASGNFASAVNIGTLTSTSNGTISATIPAGTVAGTGYRIRVLSSNPVSTGSMNDANIVVNRIPVQPSAITGQVSPCPSGSETYSVLSVTGVSYNWSFPTGWSQTGGGTSNNVTASIGAADGVISVTPSNTCGNGTARTLNVSVSTLPSINTHPASVEDCVGSMASLSVDASGTSINYQWKKNSVDMSGKTSATLSFSSLATSDAASYTCEVFNGCSTIVSNAASVAVNAATMINTQPSSAIYSEGSSATFSVIASGVNLSYQWKKNSVNLTDGANISGSNGNMLTISNLVSSDQADYTCFVAGDCGSILSSIGTLTLNTAMNENTLDKMLVYPCPASNFVLIDFHGIFQSGKMRIFDVTGRMMKEESFVDQSVLNISLVDFESGVYQVQFLLGDKLHNTVIIKE